MLFFWYTSLNTLFITSKNIKTGSWYSLIVTSIPWAMTLNLLLLDQLFCNRCYCIIDSRCTESNSQVITPVSAKWCKTTKRINRSGECTAYVNKPHWDRWSELGNISPRTWQWQHVQGVYIISFITLSMRAHSKERKIVHFRNL